VFAGVEVGLMYVIFNYRKKNTKLELKIKNLDFAKLIPIGALIVTFCSSINYVIYYRFFNIKIVDYLTITEYASLFIEHILAYLFIIIGGLVYYFLCEKLFTTKERNLVVSAFIISIIYTLIRLFFYSEKNHERINEITYIVYYSILFFCYLKKTWNNELKLIVFLVTTSIVFSISNGFISAYKMLENDNKLTYYFKFKEYSIRSSETYIYLGKSEKYLFFYNNRKNTSEIINAKDIEKTAIKEGDN